MPKMSEQVIPKVRAEKARRSLTNQQVADAAGLTLRQLELRLAGDVALTLDEAEQLARAVGLAGLYDLLDNPHAQA